MNKIIVTLILSTFTFIQLKAQDIQSSSTGFSAYGAFTYSSWSSESFFLSDLSELEPIGLGLKLGVGYGFTERLSVHANHYSVSFNREFDWDRFNFSMQTLSARFTFGATLSKWRPLFEGGLSLVSNKVDPISLGTIDEFELRNKGLGLHLGGGINYYINTNLVISAQANYVYGSFSNTELSGETYDPEETVDFALLHFNVGVRYFID